MDDGAGASMRQRVVIGRGCAAVEFAGFRVGFSFASGCRWVFAGELYLAGDQLGSWVCFSVQDLSAGSVRCQSVCAHVFRFA